MRLPTRKSELAKRLKVSDDPVYLTKEGLEKLKRQLERLENDLPQAIEDTRRTGEFGDFSENAEYREAKHRMRSIRNRITRIQEKLKLVIVIEQDESGTAQLGSTVVLESGSEQKIFYLVGPQETNPSKGRISHKSPLGARLMNKSVGDSIELPVSGGQILYTLTEIR